MDMKWKTKARNSKKYFKIKRLSINKNNLSVKLQTKPN